MKTSLSKRTVASLKKQILIVPVVFLLLVMLFSNVASAADYEKTFQLVNHPGGSVSYSLAVSITSSLYSYFIGQNHDFSSSADFAKFVTPYSVKPIADALWMVCSDGEVFTYAALSMMQQIPYEVSPAAYPVETLELNYGDCASFSFLVASILKAGGLNVVLLEYPTLQHMNVGVSLPYEPTYARSNVYWVNYNNTRYYIAETTGDDFPNGWRVGECPPELTQATPTVIGLENSEQYSPGQVSASFKQLNPSQVSISVSSSFVMENSLVSVDGLVSPSSSGNVSIYANSIFGSWQVLATVAVGENGSYAYQWAPESGGICYLEASYSGNQNYAGADSTTATLFIIPLYSVLAIVLGFLLSMLILAFWLINTRRSPSSATIEKTQTPTSSSPQKPQQSSEKIECLPSQSARETADAEAAPTESSRTNATEETVQTKEIKPSVGENQTSAGDPSATTLAEGTSPPSQSAEPKPQQTEEPNKPVTQTTEEQHQVEKPEQENQTPETCTLNPT